MKFNILITTCLIVSLASCAFKKDTDVKPIQSTSHETLSKEDLLFAAVKSSPYEEVNSLISEFPKAQIQNLELDGLTLLEIAIQRGSASITSLLLQNGASPFRKGRLSSVKPYQQIRYLPADVATVLGKAIVEPFHREMISAGSAKETWSKFQSWGMNCNDLLNVHSYFGVFMGFSSPHIEAIAKNHCEGLLESQYYNTWIMSELISQIRAKPLPYSGFIFYLSKLRDLNKLQLELETSDGKLVVTPYSLLNLALHISSLHENHERIRNLLTTLSPAHTDNVVIMRSENTTVLDRSFYLDIATEAEIEELGTRFMMATGPLGLSNFSNCIQHCHEPDSLSIH